MIGAKTFAGFFSTYRTGGSGLTVHMRSFCVVEARVDALLEPGADVEATPPNGGGAIRLKDSNVGAAVPKAVRENCLGFCSRFLASASMSTPGRPPPPWSRAASDCTGRPEWSIMGVESWTVGVVAECQLNVSLTHRAPQKEAA